MKFHSSRKVNSMKVLIGQFVTESNANVPDLCRIVDYDIAFGEECIRLKMYLMKKESKLFRQFMQMPEHLV